MRINNFYKEKISLIFSQKENIIDVGGGLRLKENNRGTSHSYLADFNWMLNHAKVRTLDKVADYNPDIVADIQWPYVSRFLPSKPDAFVCIALLEHVEEPQKAINNMWNALEPGGFLFIYTPFLYPYHPMKGYYQDFYRFTPDALRYMCRDFSSIEVHNERGAIETLVNLIPWFTNRVKAGNKLTTFLDFLFGKRESNQSSGFYVFCIK